MKNFSIYFILIFILGCNSKNENIEKYKSKNIIPIEIKDSTESIYQLNNEELIISFLTKKNKLLSVCKDKNDSYIVYRYGSKNNIELEFPKDKTDSWAKFMKAYYSRGGGHDNAGYEFDLLKFDNDSYQYIIYEEYDSVTDEISIGIRVSKEKEIDIKGRPETQKGNLYRVRSLDKIKKSEDFF